METSVLLVGLLLSALSALAYWVFIAPQRARRKRREALGRATGNQAWDPRVYGGRRNR